MEIKIDTSKESKEDILKIIKMLKVFVEEYDSSNKSKFNEYTENNISSDSFSLFQDEKLISNHSSNSTYSSSDFVEQQNSEKSDILKDDLLKDTLKNKKEDLSKKEYKIQIIDY